MQMIYLIIGLMFGYTFKALLIDEGRFDRKRLRDWKELFPLTRYHYQLMDTLSQVNRVGYQPIHDDCNLMWDMFCLGLVEVKAILPGVGTLYVLTNTGTELYVYYRDKKGGII
jgi:hypothetical protein